MTILHPTGRTAAPTATVRGYVLRLVGAQLWRVTDRRGRAVGHVRAEPEPEGTRYRARRFHAARGAFVDVGAFWSLEDAVDCLHYLR